MPIAKKHLANRKVILHSHMEALKNRDLTAFLESAARSLFFERPQHFLLLRTKNAVRSVCLLPEIPKYCKVSKIAKNRNPGQAPKTCPGLRF